MPIKLTPRGDANGIFWDTGLGIQRIEHSAVQGRPGNKKHMAGMEAAVQAALDTRVKLTDLASDEETKLSDPGDDPRLAGRMFYGDADGTKDGTLPAGDTYVISRAVVVTVLSWDGAAYSCETRRA